VRSAGGRVTLLAVVVLAIVCAPAANAFRKGPKKMHREVVTRSDCRYMVEVGGTLDEFNTFEYGPYHQSRFQPNVSVIITNTGNIPVANPRIVVNDRRDWYSMEGIIAEVFRPGLNDKERAFALWDWCRRNLSEGHDHGGTLWGDDRSVVRFLNCFGTGACGTFHIVMPLIGDSAGMECDAGVVGHGAHAVQRERYDGGSHFFDCMLSHGDRTQPRGHFPLALDNQTVPSAHDIWDDRYLLARAGSAPSFGGILTYFGPGTSFWPMKHKWREWHNMSILLRPGESIERTWQPPECVWTEGEHWAKGRPSGGGKVRYEPRLTKEDAARDAESVENLALDKGQARPAEPGRSAQLVYQISSPYVITGARVGGSFMAPADGAVEVMLSFDGEEWESIWRSKQGDREATVSLDERPEFHKPVFAHHYFLKARIAADAPAETAISGLWLEALFQTYLPSLPSLGAGKNNVQYHDNTADPHEVTIEHCWTEATAPIPPAPAAAVRPADGTDSGFDVMFEWRMPAESRAAIDAYEFFLSPRADLAWPLLVCYHSVVYSPEPKFAPPTTDAFIDGRKYYWRVRARSADGVWGPWSETWSFVARGPGPAQNPEIAFDPATGEATLTWQPPESGRPAVRYEVYGSDAPGFTPLRQPRESSNIALQPSVVILPGNLIGETTDTSFNITERTEPFYRVVAVDEGSSRSQPTACAALPHPALAAGQPMMATSGQPFEASIPVIRSMGLPVTDCKGPPRWGVDTFSLQLKQAPEWLTLDPGSGVLRGTPPPEAKGEHRVTVELTNAEGQNLSREYYILVREAGR